MKIVKGKEQEYKDWYEKNSDPYGRACFTYAERLAGMMEEKIEASEDDEMKVIVDNAKQLSAQESMMQLCEWLLLHWRKRIPV